MAIVKDVQLLITKGSSRDKRKITVNYTIIFSHDEAGKEFKVSINLFGEDISPDDDISFFFSEQKLFTFVFGRLPSLKKYKTIIAEAGEHSFSETKEINKSTLNEDPGLSRIRVGINSWATVPHLDEVFARVAVFVDDRSPTLKLFA